MKKIILWIAVIAVCAGLMVGVSALYNHLGDKVENEVPQLTLPQGASPSLKDEENEPQASETDAVVNTPETNTPETGEPDTNVPESEPDSSADTEAPESEASESETNEPETEPEFIEFNAPDFTFYDVDGNPIKLSDYAGKPIVLNIWATWCYYCTVEMPDFDEMYKKYPEVQFLMVNATGVNGETVASAKKYIESNGFEFPVFYDLDGAGLNTYYITSFPTTILITASGELVYNRAGMLNADQLEGLIQQLIQLN